MTTQSERSECACRVVATLTPDECRFFAYMAEQRFRTVVEKDPEVRDRLRDRWREVALLFDPDYRVS